MNINSYNVTDVAYHYIGLRVLDATAGATREEQFAAVTNNVSKYAIEKALRLMLPEPRGNFASVGEKVLQELSHLDLAQAVRGKGYELTNLGATAVHALNTKAFLPLRHLMAHAHLEKYENLRTVVLQHVRAGPLFNPIVEASRGLERQYLLTLLRPTFKVRAEELFERLQPEIRELSPKRVEDAMRAAILVELLPNAKLSVPLFRAMVDRLVSLRLINVMRVERDECEFAKSYSPCVGDMAARPWHRELAVKPLGGAAFVIYLSEPDMMDVSMQEELLGGVFAAFDALAEAAGYYDVPDVRDYVCEKLMIPEAAFDEGVNAMLDRHPSPLTVGLQYERISGRRKPLVRSRESTNIYNLIRRG